ncbi:MAG: four-carbon acid sugar kinase family protein [Bacteroidota bacterium]
MSIPIQHKDQLFASLPPIQSDMANPSMSNLFNQKIDTIIVLDDDPTGTQTVDGVPVLTSWSKDILVQEFKKRTPVFYLLTNSRSLTETASIELTQKIGQQIKIAAQITETRYWVISRSDSTLRGHYPAEMDALKASLGFKNGVEFIIPAFFEGGRYTIKNVHYVLQGDEMVPAAETIYAKDHVFAYQSSNLVDWIIEKTKGKVNRAEIETFDIPMLRQNTKDALVKKLNKLQSNTICIVNAASYADLYAFSMALSQASIQPIFRTAASFVKAIAGLSTKPLLGKAALIKNERHGGLIVVGSYVATTTRQLNHLMKASLNLISIEISIPKILELEGTDVYVNLLGRQIDQHLVAGKSVVLYTSRNLISAQSDDAKQQIGQKVSQIVTDIIKAIQIQPAFLLTKGGITSSDVATKGLSIKRAMVMGQLIKGVPVWKLGTETKFPDSIQIIFPGNVGQDDSLTEIVRKLTS